MRGIHIQALALFLIIILFFRLYDLQMWEEQYKTEAQDNIIKRIDIIPQRGLIFDRNNKLLVFNQPIFDILLYPKKTDSLELHRIADYFSIPMEDLQSEMRFNKNKPFVIKEQLTAEKFASYQDHLQIFPSLDYSPHFIREYMYNTLANTLGYVKEIDTEVLKKDSLHYYKKGEFAGKIGIEKYYEKELRGKKGMKYIITDARNNYKGMFKDGLFDSLAVMGKDVKISVDIDLQQYAEQLMENKRGAVVIIENKTGEILSIVSAPSYNPNLLAGKGKEVSQNFMDLSKRAGKPLFHRAIMTKYPPGSTFKTIMSLIGLHEKSLDVSTTFYCNRNIVNCHSHKKRNNLIGAIENSCNPYFFQAFYKVLSHNNGENPYKYSPKGLKKWTDHLYHFGLGHKLGIDIPFENSGMVPTVSYYNRIYGKKKWKVSNITSLAIGQGELGATPLQLANLSAIIANRGWYIKPHLIRSIDGKATKDSLFTQPIKSYIDSTHYEVIVEAMKGIKTSFFAFYGMQEIGILLAGKTGTVQNPHGDSHSVFIAFAPADDPVIALSVYVENIGDGGRWAGPIASLLIEKYLKNRISKKRKWIEQLVLDYEMPKE